MIGKVLLALWIIRCLVFTGGNDVSAHGFSGDLADLERLDEIHDREIFKAVVDSMKQWESMRKSHRAKREASTVCYEDVGCFEDTGPFSYLEMLPSPPKDVGTRFLVYGARGRQGKSYPIEVAADKLDEGRDCNMDPNLPTKVIVHGFGSDCDHVWVYEMKSALMSVHKCNIVCVDWGPGSAVPNYLRAAANTRLVGRQLAKLVKSLNVPLEKVHLIGFSLGAHVAGFAGAELGNVSRITGLDPAGPLFESQDPQARLDETDANFVDVIHSNGEQLILGGLGSWQPMGDVDFYPNGGRMQSGCSNIFLGAVSDIIWSSTVEGRSLCNHRRAYKLFTDSVSPKCRFPAFRCEKGYEGLIKGDCFPCDGDEPCGDMGYYSNKLSSRGQMYLITREEEPFCAHQYRVRVYNSRGERPERSYGRLEVTLVGEGSFNDTFVMTRKDDEELHVGSILQKIVVPHPAVSNFEAVEVKYKAYNGWISSGLENWSIDKVVVTDSYGKTWSVCQRGLILESGRPVYLMLFSGECDFPPDNTTSDSDAHAASEKVSKPSTWSVGIGPFTKEQNYERKDDSRIKQSSHGAKSFQEFESKDVFKTPVPFVNSEGFVKETNKNYQSSPWSSVDLSNDGSSNSLENPETEKGRGFQNHFNLPPKLPSNSPKPAPDTTTVVHDPVEVHEPVLRPLKKETARSLRLPEITEPILRPRPSRMESKSNVYSPNERHEILEESSTSTRAFTVQFLPERLAVILAQAEQYARQTLLPLISQYTPSFVGGRGERPKYFPPLGHFFGAKEPEKSEEKTSTKRARNLGTRTGRKNQTRVDKEGSTTEKSSVGFEDTDWVPIFNSSRNETGGEERKFEGKWFEESGGGWGPQMEDADAGPETKIEDWVKGKEAAGTVSESPTTPEPSKKNAQGTSSNFPTTENLPFLDDEKKLDDLPNVSPTRKDDDKKFIPLLNFDDEKETKSNAEFWANPGSLMATHIQKIPRRPFFRDPESRAIVFPWAYGEGRPETKTKYIPLSQEERVSDTPFVEKTR